MKAIIPVAGSGTKLRPHTYSQPKALIPIAGKTILSFIVDQLHEAGITEFIFILGYMGEKIKDYVEQTYPNLTAHFVYQVNRTGTARAIELTRDFVDNDEVFIVMGDTICEYDVKEVLQSPDNILGIKRVDDPSNFGVAEMSDEGMIERVVEKPSIPKSNMALVGFYKIKETKILFDCLHQIFVKDVRSHGEYQLTDALECMIEKGIRFKSYKVKHWYDCGKKETLLASNATLMNKLGGNIHPSAEIDSAIIIQPVTIAAGTVIKNSVIGPNVSIGTKTTIQHSIVRDSLIGSYTNLFEVVIDNSIIGSDANVKGLSRSLDIGDNTAIDFG
jgi:dTDP-glucose pyrophosphorylase